MPINQQYVCNLPGGCQESLGCARFGQQLNDKFLFVKATGICGRCQADLLKTKQIVSGGVLLLMGSRMISAIGAGRYGGGDVTVGVHRIA